MHAVRTGRNRAGTTYVEQLLMLTLLGLLLTVGVAAGGRWLDRAAVAAATRSATDAFAAARDHAVAAGTRTAVRIDVVQGRLLVHARGDTIARLSLTELHRVSLEATRDSMAYAPSGIGWGASNLRLVLRRGAAADTVVVSRLGRVR